MGTPPTGTVTFLFTDVEGSTKWWEEHPVAMQAALRLHDEILRRQAEDHGGYVFSTGGDAFAVAFATAHEALDAAADAQRALASQAWPSPIVLRVRMGLHSGEAVERDGNYYGPPLNRTARLMRLAHGGQILCSEVTAGLVADRATMRDLGQVTLKDLPRPQRVYQPLLDGLTVDFPPLPTVDSGRHSLPTPLTPLIGRDAEVRRVLDLLASHRLVTLTGVGGCGKTRLALAAAAGLANEVADGVFFVELAPVSDPARVAEVVAGTFELSLADGIDRGNVARFLAGKEVLLVLDNCEHLLDEVPAFVDELLSAGSKARVLATSRESLDVPGEQSHRVPSLDERNSLALLLARATEASDSFRLDADEEATALELCRRLDGIPLALELAAAQLTHLPPAELLRRLDDRFRLLVGGPRRHMQRHQTLQAVVEWSWDLLDPDERRVLASLSVFVGGWTLDAAEGVSEPLSDAPIATVMRSLVSKSLVEPRRTAGGPRYRMLETVRLFAQHKLVEMGLAEGVRVAHRDWFVQWVEAIPLEQRLWSLPWIQSCADDLDNVAAAFEWSLDHDELTQSATLLVSTAGTLHMYIGSEQGFRWVKTLLDREVGPKDRVAVLTAGVVAAAGVEDHRTMEEWGAEAEGLVGWAPPALACFLLQWRASTAMVRHPERAALLLDAAEEAARATGSELAIGYIAAWRLHAELCTPAGRVIHPSVTPSRFGGSDALGWGNALNAATLQAARLGDLEEAERLLLRGPSQYANPADEAGTFALCVALAGDRVHALVEARSVLDCANQRSDVDWHVEMALSIAIAHLRAGDTERAYTYFEALRQRRAPLRYPILFDMRREFSAQARSQLDDDSVERAQASARDLDVEAILDLELR